LSNGAIFNDLELTVTMISRARHYSMVTVPETAPDRQNKCSLLFRSRMKDDIADDLE